MSDNDQRDPFMCAAYGCPCYGTMSNSTNGTSEWFCQFHHGSEAGSWQAITAALNANKWLVDVCEVMRKYLRTARWPEVRQRMERELGNRQRPDLLMQPCNVEKHTGDKSEYHWMLRLYEALGKEARSSRSAPLYQVPQAQTQAADTWQRVQMPMPDAA